MRKLPTLFTTLLCCSSLALAQMDDEVSSTEEFEDSAPAVEKPHPLLKKAPKNLLQKHPNLNRPQTNLLSKKLRQKNLSKKPLPNLNRQLNPNRWPKNLPLPPATLLLRPKRLPTSRSS